MKKTARAFSWSLIDTYANFGLKLIFTIAIARILSPSDYGIVAYTGLFLGIATFISEGGFTTALVHKNEPTQTDFSTTFIYTVASSFFFFFLYLFLARPISTYFSEPALESVLKVASLSFVVNSLGAVHMALLVRALDFKKQAKINFIASTLSGVIGLVLASAGMHYWALVIQTVSSSILRLIGLIIAIKWIPNLVFSKTSFLSLFNFGIKTFLQGLLESIFREIQAMIIGKQFLTRELGLYDRGKKFYDLLIIQTSIAINKVLFPLLSRNRENEADYKLLYSRTYNYLFLIMAPLSLSLILIAKPLVIILLTSRWIQVVPIMQLFFIGGGVFLLLYFNSTTILASNKPGLFLTMDFIQKGMLTISLLFTYKISIYAIIIGWLITYYLYFFLYEFVMAKQGYFKKEKYQYMLEVLLCLVPLPVVSYLATLWIKNMYLLLSVQCILFPLLFILAFKLLRFKLYIQFTEDIKPYLKPRFHSYL